MVLILPKLVYIYGSILQHKPKRKIKNLFLICQRKGMWM